MVTLSKQFVQDVKENVDIVDVIGEYVQLKKAGAEFNGLCPFHNEKSGSFDVNSEKGVYLCRGCGATGDHVKFLVEYTGMSFMDTMEKLAGMANMPMPVDDRPETPDEKEVRLLQEANAYAQELYRHALNKSPDVQKYLKSRNLTDEMIEKFAIGYSPGPFFLERNMIKKGFSYEIMEKAGLIYKSSNDQNTKVEWMSGRVVFPIRDGRGKTIGFGGRSLDPEEKKRKYVNTPETRLFKKGNVLYGFFEGKNEIRKKNEIIVAEGYLDTVIPSGNGIGNIGSAMGTALRQETIVKLFKTCDNVVFCFDGDAAGHRAAVKAMENVLPVIDVHHTAKFCFIPENLDPDEYVGKYGAAAFQEIIAKSMPLSKFVISEYSSRNDMTSAEGRARFALDTMSAIQQITVPFLRAVITAEIQSTVGANIPLPTIAPKPIVSPPRRRDVSNTPTEAHQEDASLAMRVLSLLVNEPEAALFFEAKWLNIVKSTREEIEAVHAVIHIVKSGHNAGRDDYTKDTLLSALSRSQHGLLVKQATEMDESKLNGDFALELSRIVDFLSEQNNRATVINSLVQKRVANRPH